MASYLGALPMSKILVSLLIDARVGSGLVTPLLQIHLCYHLEYDH